MEKEIRILHIIEQLPLGGGAENLLYTLARNIDRNRFNLLFCCLSGGGHIADKLKDEGFKVFCLENYRMRHFYKKIGQIIRLIKTEGIDIVHTHLISANRWGLIAARMSHVPVICKTEHGILTDLSTSRNRLLDKLFSSILYVSESQRNIFKGDKYDPSRHIVVHNALDEKKFTGDKTRDEIRSCHAFSEQDIVIGIVGRLVIQKGHDYLFEAFKEVKKKYPAVRMLVIGDGPEGARLKESAQELELDVLFLSSRDDIPELMKTMDIYVQPSLQEPFGIAIAEAMFSGLPVIASDVGGIPEVVVDGETGILVPPKDPDAIKNALLKLIGNPDSARTMGARGKRVAESKFSGSRYAKDMEKLYMSLMDAREHR